MTIGYMGPGGQWVTPADQPSGGLFGAMAAIASGAGTAWAGHASAVTAGAGAFQWFTIGIGGASLFRSDGTYWRPVNGQVTIGRQAGTIANPVSSIVLGSAGIITLPSVPTIPASLAVPGSSALHVRATFIHRGALGAVTPRILVGPTSGSVTGAQAIQAITLAATDTSAAYLEADMDIRTLTTQTAHTFATPNAAAGTSANLADTTNDFGVAQFVMFGVLAGTAGTASDTLDLVSYEVLYRA